MGQDKKQLMQLLKFVKDLYDNPDNKEFAAGIQAIVMEGQNQNKDDNLITDIYEYCIRKILNEQAESLYVDFPLSTIRNGLIEDYVKMERAHRDNNIDDFGIRLYRQIETIVRYLAKDKTLEDVARRMMDVPYLVEGYKDPKVDKRIKKMNNGQQIKTIAQFVLIPSKRSTIEERKTKLLSEQYATDMARLVIYYVCFGGMMQTGNMFEQWKNQTSAFSDIYSIRNRVHGGDECNEYDSKRYDAIKASETQSYFRLMSFLVFLVEGVKNGFPLPDALTQFAQQQ